jgi:hypothetical protein
MTQDDKMKRLRKLHGTPARKARIASLVLVISGILLLTAGLFLIITGTAMQNEKMKALTALVCLAGWLLAALGYPAYDWVADWQHRRITPEVLRLAEELLM